MNILRTGDDPAVLEIINHLADGHDPTPEQLVVLTKDYDKYMMHLKRQRIGSININVHQDGGVLITSDYRHVYGHA